MNPSSYTISGTGPAGANFSQTVIASSSATITDLVAGSWTVSVTVYNSSNVAIGYGTGTATISTSTATPLALTVSAYDGTGSLALSIGWTTGDVTVPTVSATLTPLAGGVARTLDFTVASTGATYSVSGIAAGYYRLNATLLDSGVPVAGAVDIVRIVKDQATTGSFIFNKVNSNKGSLILKVTTDLNNPLSVSIVGGAASKSINQSLALTSTVTGTSDAVTYAWYMNGLAVGTESAYLFGTDWAAGTYRIDLLATTADGSSAGSASVTIEVTAEAAGTEGLAYTLINGDTEYSVAKGTADTTGTVVIPATYNGKNVTAIDVNAFYGCTGLTSIVIPQTVTTIGNQAFMGCTGLTSAVIPEGVTDLSTGLFKDCSLLVSVSLPSTLKTIGDSAFFQSGLKSVIIPTGVTSIGNFALKYCTSLTSVTIPVGVTNIGIGALSFCFSLTRVTIPEGVASISDDTFLFCNSLTSVTIPASVTTLGGSSFSSCSKLASVTLSEGLVSIGYNAFGDCTALTGLTIPSTVTAIDSSAFSGCPGLGKVTVKAVEPPFAGTDVFNGCSGLTSVLVPAASVDAYKAKAGWSKYASLIAAQ